MSAPTASTRTDAFRWSAALTGVLVMLAFLMVGAWPMLIVLGLPPLVAAFLDRRRTAAVLAGLPSLAIVIWWAVYFIGRDFRLGDPPQVDLVFLLAGPAAAVTVPLAVALLTRGDRFSRRPIEA